MKLHHSTVKLAERRGVILTCDDDSVTAHLPEFNLSVTLEVDDQEALTEIAKDALVHVCEIRDWRVYHPSFRVDYEDGDFVGYSVETDEELARDPDRLDLFTTLEEIEANGTDEEEEEEEEEEETSGSVVPEKYKVLYAERGNPTHCGDWLALTLNKLCRVMDGKKETTDLDRLEAIANANGVAPERWGKLGVATNGWQGRFRMTVRNMLTKVCAGQGYLFVPEGCGVDADTQIEAPREWCLEHAPKAKPAKAKVVAKAA